MRVRVWGLGRGLDGSWISGVGKAGINRVRIESGEGKRYVAWTGGFNNAFMLRVSRFHFQCGSFGGMSFFLQSTDHHHSVAAAAFAARFCDLLCPRSGPRPRPFAASRASPARSTLQPLEPKFYKACGLLDHTLHRGLTTYARGFCGRGSCSRRRLR